MEEIGATNPVRNSWSENPSNPFLSFYVAPMQTTSFHQNNYYAGIRACRFFFLCFFYFHRTLFSWACVTPEIITWNTHLVHTLNCLITPSFLHGFQPNLYQYFSYVCSTTQTTFSIKQTPQSIWEVFLHCLLIVSITWTPCESFE